MALANALPSQAPTAHNFTTLTVLELGQLYCYYKKNNWTIEAISEHMLNTTGKSGLLCTAPLPQKDLARSAGSTRSWNSVCMIILGVTLGLFLIFAGLLCFFHIEWRCHSTWLRRRQLMRASKAQGFYAAMSYSNWLGERAQLARQAAGQNHNVVVRASFDSAEVCAICIEVIHPVQTVRGLRCMHVYHVACIDDWIRDHNSCPVCRCDITKARRQHRRRLRDTLATRMPLRGRASLAQGAVPIAPLPSIGSLWVTAHLV